MGEIKLTEKQTKNHNLQRLVDCCVILLLSIIILSIYESDWSSVHASKDNMYAIYFDMFGTYYSFAFILMYFFVPNFFEFISGSGRNFLYRYTSENKLSARFVRALKIVIVTVVIVLSSIMFADKYSRVEFYDNGSIIEYNKDNQVIYEYTESDINFIEIKTNYGHTGRHTTYWTEAVIYIEGKNFVIREKNYIAPWDYEDNIETERSLYGLSRVKENFSDKIKINTENIDTLLEVEHLYYTKDQARKLCGIFEVDFDEIMLWLEEEWDIVLDGE